MSVGEVGELGRIGLSSAEETNGLMMVPMMRPMNMRGGTTSPTAPLQA